MSSDSASFDNTMQKLSSFGAFLPSAVVPGVCWTSAGSGARQDDAGGLSTSSMLTVHAA